MIRAAVVEGVATATEVSTIGIVYAVLVGLLVYRQFDWRRLPPMLVETASLTGRDHLHRRLRHRDGLGPDAVRLLAGPGDVRWRRMPGGAYGFLAVSIVAFVVLGSVLEGIPAIVLFGPLLFPDRQAGRRARGALRDGRDLRDGHRPVRAAVRRRLLRRLRDQQGRPGRRHSHIWGYVAALLVGLADRRRRAVDLDRLPQILTRDACGIRSSQ